MMKQPQLPPMECHIIAAGVLSVSLLIMDKESPVCKKSNVRVKHD
jgi:hypothetical protein